MNAGIDIISRILMMPVYMYRRRIQQISHVIVYIFYLANDVVEKRCFGGAGGFVFHVFEGRMNKKILAHLKLLMEMGEYTFIIKNTK